MPYSLHKIKFICILTIFLLIGLSQYSFSAEKTTFKALYPIPFISTDQMILKPRSESSMANCDIGEIYVDDNTGDIVVCGINNAKSRNIWTQNGNFVYPTDVNLRLEEVTVGDRKNTPNTFTIFGPEIGGNQNLISMNLLNGMNSTGITLKMDGTYIPGPPSQNTENYIDFHVGDLGQNYDGRILYTNSPSLQGFGFYGELNRMNMWISRTNHLIGIGTTNPSERLDIIGDIETNKIILDQDGTLGANPPTDLKVEYSSGGNGYYAVYAP